MSSKEKFPMQISKSIEFSRALQQPLLDRDKFPSDNRTIILDTLNNSSLQTIDPSLQISEYLFSRPQSKLARGKSYFTENSYLLESQDEDLDLEYCSEEQKNYERYYQKLLNYKQKAKNKIASLFSEEKSSLANASQIKATGEGEDEVRRLVEDKEKIVKFREEAKKWINNVNSTTECYLDNPEYRIKPNEITGVEFAGSAENIILSCGRKLILKAIDNDLHLAFIESHDKKIVDFAFCLNKSIVISGSEDGVLKIHEIKEFSREDEGKSKSWKFELLNSINAHTDKVNSVAVSQDGEIFASGSKDKTLKLFNQRDGRLLHQWKMEEEVLKIAMSPNRKYLICSCKDEAFYLQSLEAPFRNLFSSIAQGGPIRALAFSPDSDTFVIAGKLKFGEDIGKGFKMILLSSFKEIVTKMIDEPSELISVQFRENENHLICCYSRAIYEYDHINQSLSQLNLESKNPSIEAFNRRITSMAYKSQGSLIVLALNNSVLDYYNNFFLKACPTPKLLQIICIRASPDGLLVASGGEDCYLRLFWVKSGELLYESKDHKKAIVCIAFSFCGRKIMTGSRDHSAKISKIEREKDSLRLTLLININLEDYVVSSLCFSPIDTRILIGTKKKNLFLYDIDYEQQEESFIPQYKRIFDYGKHLDDINAVVFSPDGSKFASGSSDKGVVQHKITLGKNSTLRSKKIADHENAVRTLDYSCDGKYLISGGYDCQIILMDAEKEVIIYNWKFPDNEENNAVLAISFNPTATEIVAGLENGNAMVIDVLTKDIIRKIYMHEGKVRGALFTNDNRKIITAGEDGQIIIFDNWKDTVETNYLYQAQMVRAVAVSPDGKTWASGGDDKLLKIFDIESYRQIHSIPHEDWISCIAFSSEGLQIVTGSGDKLVRLFNCVSGCLIRTFYGHKSWITSVAFSPSGHYIVSGSVDKSFRTFERYSGFQLKCFPNEKARTLAENNEEEETPFNLAILPWQSSMLLDDETSKQQAKNEEMTEVNCIVFTPDESTIIIGLGNGKIKVIDFKTGEEQREINSANKLRVNSIALSLTALEILVVGADDKLIILDFNKGDSLKVFGNLGEINTVCVAPNGSYVAAGGSENTAYIIKTNGFEIRSVELAGTIFSAAFFPDNQNVLFASMNKIYKLHTQNDKYENLSVVENANCTAFSPNGKLLAIGDDNLKLFDGISGIYLKDKKSNNSPSKINALKFNGRGNKIATGSVDKKLTIFETTYCAFVRSYTFPFEITSLDFANDKDLVYLGSDTGSVFSFNFEDITAPKQIRIGIFHSSKVLDIHYMEIEGGPYLLTYGEDLNIILFDTLQKNKKYEIKPHKERINTLCVSSSKKFFITGSNDKSAKLFEISSGSEVRNFSLAKSRVIGAAFSSNESYVIICDAKGTLQIYHMETGFQINTLEVGEAVNSLSVSPFRDNLVVGVKTGVKFISQLLNSQKKLGARKSILDRESITLDGFQIKSNDLDVLPYPLKMNKLILTILQSGLSMDIILEKLECNHLKTIKNQKLNCMDYCYLLRDEFKLSAWDYFISDSDYQDEALDKIAKMFLYRSFPNVHLMRNKAKLIEKIAFEYSSELPEIFRAFSKEIDSINLPKSVEKLTELTLETSSCYPSSNEVKMILLRRKNLKDSEEPEQQLPDKCYKSLYKINFCYVSPKDIDELLWLFSSFKMNHPIYRAESFLDLIRHQWWKFGRKEFLLDLLFYLVLLIAITINCIYLYPIRQSSNKKHQAAEILSLLIDVGIIITVIFFYAVNEYKEVMQVYAENTLEKVKTHFRSLWNVLDFFVIFTGLLFSLTDIIYISTGTQAGGNADCFFKLLCSFYFFIAWIRVLGLARGFRFSSPLIRVISRVIKDMKGFFFALFFMMTGLSFASYVLQKNYEHYSIWDFFKIFYYILLGDYGDFKNLDTPINEELFFFILLLTTISTVFVMLTLLIAIISDSFSKVMSLEKQAEAYEKLQWIYSRRSRNTKPASFQNEQVCIYSLKRDINEVLEDPIDKLRFKIEKIEKNQKKIRENQDRDSRLHERNTTLLENYKKGIDEAQKILSDKLDKLARSLNDQIERKNTIDKEIKWGAEALS